MASAPTAAPATAAHNATASTTADPTAAAPTAAASTVAAATVAAAAATAQPSRVASATAAAHVAAAKGDIATVVAWLDMLKAERDRMSQTVGPGEGSVAGEGLQTTTVDVLDEEGRTMLMRASALGNVTLVQLLLNHGASVNACDSRGGTSLMRATMAGAAPAVKLLLSARADAHFKADARKSSALEVARAMGSRDVIAAFDEAGMLAMQSPTIAQEREGDGDSQAVIEQRSPLAVSSVNGVGSVDGGGDGRDDGDGRGGGRGDSCVDGRGDSCGDGRGGKGEAVGGAVSAAPSGSGVAATEGTKTPHAAMRDAQRRGNARFGAGDWGGAADAYTQALHEALATSPPKALSAVILANRAACYLNMQQARAPTLTLSLFAYQAALARDGRSGRREGRLTKSCVF
uniref:Uncharacterized protein n=1 Tax=Chrysotila carterae TaxID=13221 RepID=A0A7S4C4G1_CHRCT